MLLAGLASLAWGLGWIDIGAPSKATPGDVDHRATAIWLGAALLALSPVTSLIWIRYRRPVADAMTRFARAVDSLSPRARWLDLVFASVLGLFLEVALIRWHGTEFRACAYLKNVTLLACFLGLGLGFARAHRSRLSMPIMLPLLIGQVLVMDVLSLADADRAIRNPQATEVYWGMGHITTLLHAAVFYGFFAALFVSTIMIFIPIGQLTGRLMQPAAPIASYTVNIIGSIVGVLLFAAASFFWLPPSLWFAAAVMLALWLVRHDRFALTAGALAGVLAVGWLGFEPRSAVRNVYSPYQRLEVTADLRPLADGRTVRLGTKVNANKTWYLAASDLSPEFVDRWGGLVPGLRERAAAYDLSYAIGSVASDVLIVGAGAGNDVAAALRGGAVRVDAVEIDPAILELGRREHPESPYRSPRVHVRVGDARAFLQSAPPATYDLVVFGLLDSHTLLSGMAAIRLDNFVYTIESMRDARRVLRPTGRLCLSFAVAPDTVFAARVWKMLRAVFGHPPRTFTLQGTDTAFVIAVDPDAELTPPAGAVESTERVFAAAARLDPPPASDDWPFPFLEGRRWADFPRSYLWLIGLLGVISVAWVAGARERVERFEPHFFFLGGAFLLVETKGITELALVFGTTWVVTSVVIVAILTLILMANWLVAVVRPHRVWPAYLALLASLAAGYFVPVERLLPLGRMGAGLASAGLLCLPLYFAGVIFATSLSRCRSLPSAFASNLLGAILGGLCEYASMVVGFRNLYLVGMGIYALSWVALWMGRDRDRWSSTPAGC